jgi:WD40 repeat protein
LPECPYVGLVPFDEKDAAYFFGRERESDLIVANLTASRLTLLYAPSGVGKTSVLRAGVLPQLHQLDEDSDDDLGLAGAAVAYVSTWRDDPLESIAAAVADAVSRVTGADIAEKITSAPKLSASWLREVLRQSRVSAIYLIFDQFEEYFLYHPMDRGEEGLTAELGRILSARDLPVNVLLSLREDALAGLDRFEGRVPHLFDNYLRLAHLSRKAAQAAIEGPLDRYNRVAPPDQTMSIEPELIETLLDQVRTGHVRVAEEGAAPDGSASDGAASDDRGDIETPYLQLVLIRLWDHERATGSSSLRQNTLDHLGGAEAIVKSHLDNVMAGLSPAQLDVAAAVFHHLITRSGTKFALAAEDLADLSRQPVSAVQDLLETLSAGPQRILRTVPPAVGIQRPPRYEIFHDVMASAVLDWRRRYEAQQQQAESSRRLIAERQEAQAAARTARQRLRRTQFIAVGMALMLVVVCVFGVFAYQSSRDALQQTFLVQAAAALGNNNPTESLKHAVDAYNVSDDEVARDAVLKVASSPRSRVVVGPNPRVVGIVGTPPDSRHVVAYDANGGIWIIGDNGAEEHKVNAFGLRGTVTLATVNPDASRVVLLTDQGMVAIVNTATGQHIDIMTEAGSRSAVMWIGSAANGLVLVVGGSGTAATYSPETGKQVARFPGVVYEAVAMADEQHIVTSEEDKKLRVWDARTAAKTAESSTLESVPLVLRRYGQSVVGVLPSSMAVVIWNWQAGPDPVRYPVADLYDVRQLSVNEHAHTIDIAAGKEVVTYSLRDGKLQGWLPQHANLVSDTDISFDGKSIITAGADGRVAVWFRRPDQPVPSHPTYDFLAHPGGVTQVNYLRNGEVVVSLGLDGKVQWWELPHVSRFYLHNNWVVDIDLSRDGSLLATTGRDGSVHIIDPNDLSKAPIATVSADAVLRKVRFDPTEPHRVLTLGEYSTTPRLWRWGPEGNPEQLRTYAEPPLSASDYLVSLAISPNGRIVAAGDTRGTIHLWDSQTGVLRTDREFQGTGQPAYGVAFDPSGKLLAATDQGGVRLWKLGTADPPTRLSHRDAATVAFDPSGKQVVSTGEGGTVNIWTREGHLDHQLVAHGDVGASNPSFSNDGNLLAVGTAEGFVEVWDVRSGDSIMSGHHHGDSVRNVLFFPKDQTRLISSSDDTTVAQFRCPACSDPDTVIREAVEWARAD